MRRIAAATAVMALALAAGPAGAYGPAEELCYLAKPEIQESSGIVASSLTDGVFFTHNDSGDTARLFAVDHRCTLLATITVQGATASDWEDIARGPGRDGAPSLFIGDIGNNLRTRRSLTVYEVPEPPIDPSRTDQELTVQVGAAHSFIYDDGPQDAETLMVDPSTGAIVVVAKALAAGLSGVYVLEPAPVALLPLIARRIARVDLLTLGATDLLATGGDIAPGGDRVVIRTYVEAFEWTISGGDLAAAFDGAPQRIPLPDTRQGEAIAYTRDGRDLLTTTEYSGWVHRVPGD